MTAVLVIYAIIVGALTAVEYKRLKAFQVWLKPLAALGFIVIAVFGGALYWDYGLWILFGLLACAVGDLLLLPRGNPIFFKLGMGAFAAGHLLYLSAFLKISDGEILNPIAIIPILAGFAFFYWIRPKLPKDMVIPVGLYSLIIIAMVVISLEVSNIIVPLAAVLFAISDMIVARDRFVSDAPGNALAITPLYFGAQALFALSAGIGA